MSIEMEIILLALGFGLSVMSVSFAVMHGVTRFCRRRDINLNTLLQAE